MGRGLDKRLPGRLRGIIKPRGELMEKEFKEACLPCEVDMGEGKKDCIAFQDYLTPEEEEVLSMLRKLKEESHKIGDKIRTLEGDIKSASQDQTKSAFGYVQEGLHTELSVCFQQLENLRMAWKEWEARREGANRRKMLLLGYGP